MASASGAHSKGFSDDRYRRLIGELVAARRGHGLSQAVLAERLARHQQFVSRYETGERRLDIVEFVDIATSLGLDVPVLLDTIVKGG